MRNNRKMTLREGLGINPEDLLNLGFEQDKRDLYNLIYTVSFGKYGDVVFSYNSDVDFFTVDVENFPFDSSIVNLNWIRPNVESIKFWIEEFETMDGMDFCATVLQKSFGFRRERNICVKDGNMNIGGEVVGDRFNGYAKVVVNLVSLNVTLTQTSNVSPTKAITLARRIK